VNRHLENLANNFGYCCWYNLPQPVGVVLAPGQKQTRAAPSFGDVVYYSDRDSSSYNSLQVKVEHRFNHGLALTGAYTYAKNLYIQTGLSDPRNAAIDKGPWNNDLRHNFVVSEVWLIPVGPGRRFLGRRNKLVSQILGGWSTNSIVTKRSGFPFTPTVSVDLLNMENLEGQNRPDRVCNGAVSNPTINKWFE
jgi:hypothetical protein